MAETLSTDHWNTPIPLPSVDRDDPEYRSTIYWRGDVWPATVFQTLSGLAQYGHRKLVADMAGRLIDNAIQKGISEHYDSQSGAPLGVANLGMSAVLLTMAVDSLSPKHAIRVRASA